MNAKTFVDSNIWLYLFLRDENAKSSIAEQFVRETAYHDKIVISWQVVNEVTSVLLKKSFPESKITVIIEWMCRISTIQDFTEEMLLNASFLRSKHMFSFWDSLIVAATLAAKCPYLVSEDMHHGQKIGTLTIRNIFQDN